jgi:hypothetical protein
MPIAEPEFRISFGPQGVIWPISLARPNGGASSSWGLSLIRIIHRISTHYQRSVGAMPWT